MSKIKILPDILSNKIAAGEVVERPASVVKELLENSLDAGSTRINIEVEKGGRSLIRVSDNGTGMNGDDALLAIERYATSKIYKEDDLFSIKTLGFRGEALPSIAAVSRFTLETRDESSEAGTRIFIEGGKIKDVSQIGTPPGTLISVSHLFFNMPARRKFLKSVNTEMGHLADTIANIAMGHPGVRFRLIHNKKLVKDWLTAANPADRIADILGREARNDLHKIESAAGEVSVSGWMASPKITRSTSRGIYLYVNGRAVRDRMIQHALFEGFAGRLMKGQFPVAVLFIKLPPDRVDVNVHPTKNEVRFAEQNKIHGLVANAAAAVLNAADRSRRTFSGTEAWEQENPADIPHVFEPAIRFDSAQGEPPVPRVEEEARFVPSLSDPGKERKQTVLWEDKPFGDLRVIGQFYGTYILCESGRELVLIDQHAAHERIVFEQLKRCASDSSAKTVQTLLLPEVIDLGYSEADVLEKLIPKFAEMGFEIEHFGGNTFVVKSVPSILGDREISPLIIELSEKIAEIGVSSGLEHIMDECLMLMACHGAIRANQQLSGEQIKTLLNQLDRCDNPFHCPHGRPTQIKWSLSFLEKSFKRI
jgi:DNA mismatch repair protein MutL